VSPQAGTLSKARPEAADSSWPTLCATTEVDRREAERRVIDLPCRVTVSGAGSTTARIVDISTGCAAIADGPELLVGARGTLEAERLGLRLAFVVRPADDEALHVAYETDAAGAATLARTLKRLVGRRAA
jgi:hypothetical protein